ncbi:DUF4880 domain-containing protein [Brenneria populi subsp. brevivirga]|uniref:FecR family protein n=1 Tax=Brenneria populi TaxID=1505588 RepID=UPI002E19ED08|nr:DUF4880 domain-containing protein [Brenneria populi subsp. brevivirga]
MNFLTRRRWNKQLQEAREWLVRLTSGSATTSDAAAFRQWLAQSPEHHDAFAAMRGVWRQLGPLLETAPARAEPTAKAAFNINRGRRAFLATAMGAAGILAAHQLLDWPALPGLESDFSTAAGEQKSIRLQRDIALDMNTRTQIDMLASDPQSVALALRAGEAEVRAESAGEVSVRAGASTLVARGTWFNILYLDDNVSVTCIVGRVQVQCREGSLTLQPGEQARYAHSRLLPAARADLRKVLAWRQRQVVFDNTSLRDVIAEVNRYRKGRIVLLNKTLARRQVQARFTLDQLDDVIDLIQRAYGARVTTLPGDIILLS